MNKKILVLSFVAALVLSAAVIMATGENKQISLQGRLTDAAGKPLSGTYSVSFAIFAGPDGGTALGGWSETQTITVSKGLFSTRIGKTPFPPALKFDVPYYVEITVNDEPLIPRYILAASPYTIATPVIPTTFAAGAITSGSFPTSRIADKAITAAKLDMNAYSGASCVRLSETGVQYGSYTTMDATGICNNATDAP